MHLWLEPLQICNGDLVLQSQDMLQGIAAFLCNSCGPFVLQGTRLKLNAGKPPRRLRTAADAEATAIRTVFEMSNTPTINNDPSMIPR